MKTKKKLFSILIFLIFILTFLINVIEIEKNIEAKNSNDFQFTEFYIPDLKVVSIQISQASELGELIEKGLDIVDVRDLNVTAYADNSVLQWLYDSGLNFEILYDSLDDMNKQLYSQEIMMQFHTYAEMTAELEEIAEDYPEISNLHSLGTSVQGRTIWGLKISKNPVIE